MNIKIRETLAAALIAGLTVGIGIAVADEAAEAGSEAAMSEPAIAKTWKDKDLTWGPCPPIFDKPGCQVAVLHGNPANPNTDIFFQVPKGYEIPWHTHTSAERMLLVNGKMNVTYKDQDTVTLKEGTYAYGPAKKPHNATCLKGPCVLFIGFEEPVDALAHPAAQE